MVAREGSIGKKFICPVGEAIASCRYSIHEDVDLITIGNYLIYNFRCPQTLVNGTKLYKDLGIGKNIS